jgi:cobalt-zinc-cadmium efflux system membrane fusion protein
MKYSTIEFAACWGLVVFLSVAGGACSTGEGEQPEHEQPAELDNEEADHEDEAEHTGGVIELPAEKVSGMNLQFGVVEERAIGAQIETTGQVDFDQNRLAHVSPRISGRVHRVAVALGARVRAGQVLAELDSIELGRAKAEFLQAKARHQLTRDSLAREEELFGERISSEQEVLEARAALQEAQAALRTAEEMLHLYGLRQQQVDALDYDDPQSSIFPLRASFAGKVVEKHATLGELVTPEDNLFLLADLSQVWIWIDIYERDLAQVHIGDQVRVQVDAYAAEIFNGEVSYLSDRVDAVTRTIRARIDASNPDDKMRPGMFARIVVSDPHDTDGKAQALKTAVLPEGALQRDGEEVVVFVPQGENRFERREVVVGRSADGFAEVLDGVVVGEQVVTQGAFLLKSEGSKENLGQGHGH